MALDDLKESIARGAHAVQDAAGRLREELDETRTRHQLEKELDRLFTELGIEVYQKVQAGETLDDSVVVQDLVERIADVDALIPDDHDEAGGETEADAQADAALGPGTRNAGP